MAGGSGIELYAWRIHTHSAGVGCGSADLPADIGPQTCSLGGAEGIQEMCSLSGGEV